jgi:hypothetical protein
MPLVDRLKIVIQFATYLDAPTEEKSKEKKRVKPLGVGIHVQSGVVSCFQARMCVSVRTKQNIEKK